MPYKVKKNKDGSYRVTSPSGTRAKHTTKEKAKAQQRLLYAIEEDEDFLSKRRKKNKM